MIDYWKNEQSRRGQGRVNNENPISKLNCDKFLQYLNNNIDINSIECNNLVWRCIYHIIRERIISRYDYLEVKGDNICCLEIELFIGTIFWWNTI